MGYIDLTCPISHLWYLKGIPSYLTIVLSSVEPKIKTSEIEDIIYFRESIDKKYFEIFSNLSEEEFGDKSKNELKNHLNVRYDYSGKKSSKRTGAELIKTVLENIDLQFEIQKARSEIEIISENSDPKSFIRRIRILESFLSTKTNLSWMILTVLPVLPPSLRPLLELDNGRLVAADVNEIYRLIITRNQRLFDFRSLFVPDLITMQGRKLLQECVDSLIDNARVPK